MSNPASPSAMLLDALDEPSLIVQSGIVVSANRAAYALLGDAIAGRDVRLVLRHPLALEIVLAGDENDLDLQGIGSADRPWHLSVRRLADGASLVRLTDRSTIDAAERMRTDFVANASHELRTPLATIIGYAETLAEEAPLDEELRSRFGGTVGAEARRMLRIVEDLMSLSRIEADRFNPPAGAVDFGEIARIAIEQAEPLRKRRGCQIAPVVELGLAPVRGDFGQLLQLADNLLGNALRYGCNETMCRVDVEVHADGGRAMLIVRDHGDGIAAEHLPRLTERFYRIDAARSRDSGGTGLGLAIVKHIVERHRGTIDIRSEPGRGTEVRVSLPQ